MRNPIEKIYILFILSISVLAMSLPTVSARGSGFEKHEMDHHNFS